MRCTIVIIVALLGISPLAGIAATAPQASANASNTAGDDVTPAAPPAVCVGSIVFNCIKIRTNFYKVTGCVKLIETNYPKRPVGNGNVNVTFTCKDGSKITQTLATASDGTANFTLDGPSSVYTLAVNNVTKTNYRFDTVSSILKKIFSN